mmetsp:Transcript_26887/g.68101  ORF Transcript_26887/g.68101 Transcript_26887/m.68101 type:complete len:208 (-) Transcript_26887:4-627(-)
MGAPVSTSRRKEEYPSSIGMGLGTPRSEARKEEKSNIVLSAKRKRTIRRCDPCLARSRSTVSSVRRNALSGRSVRASTAAVLVAARRSRRSSSGFSFFLPPPPGSLGAAPGSSDMSAVPAPRLTVLAWSAMAARAGIVAGVVGKRSRSRGAEVRCASLGGATSAPACAADASSTRSQSIAYVGALPVLVRVSLLARFTRFFAPRGLS